MPRKPRKLIEGAVYHVYSRGNHRRAVFHDDEDRAWFMERMIRTEANTGVVHIAHCLMTNHLHLLLRPERVSLSKVMHRILGPYARWFNHRHDTVGHLFQDRFGSRPLESEFDLLQMLRYVHRNPVEAGMVGKAADWKWSSHSDYLAVNPREFVSDAVDTVLGMLDEDLTTARRTYRRVINSAAENDAWVPDRLVGGAFGLSGGPEKPVSGIAGPPSLQDLATQVAAASGVGVEALIRHRGPRELTEVRRALCRIAVEELGFTIVETASFLDRAPSMICKLLKASA